MTKEQAREYRKSLTLPYYIVYGLPYSMYAGITNQPKLRMRNHEKRTDRKYRCTDEWFILDICKTKEDAIHSEKQHHENGWNGGTFGNENHNAKLTRADVEDIRRRYPEEDSVQLAGSFNVTARHIRDIINFKKWKL